MNAPTGRNASVTEMERATCGTDLPNSFAIAVSDSPTRKKSNASSVHPRNPATVAYAASREEVGGNRPAGGPSAAAATSIPRNIAAAPPGRTRGASQKSEVRGQKSGIKEGGHT